MRVVDNAISGAVAPVPQRFVDKAFHGKAIESPVKSNIAHLAVAQIQSAGNDLAFFLTDSYPVLRGIMLHFLAGDIRYVGSPLFMGFTESFIAYKPRQSGVADGYATLFGQYLMHPLHIAAAIAMNGGQKRLVNDDGAATLFGLPYSVAAQYGPHGFSVNAQLPRYRAALHTLAVERQRRRLPVSIDHGGP